MGGKAGASRGSPAECSKINCACGCAASAKLPLYNLSCREPPAELQWYRLNVRTSDQPEAGTDAEVFVTLHGSTGAHRQFAS